MDLDFLDKIKQQAEVGDPLNGIYKLRPKMINGKAYLTVYMHNYVFDQLRKNTNVAQWGDLVRAAGKLASGTFNPVNSPEIEYNGLLIKKTVRAPKMIDLGGGAGVYRTIICGCQAAVWAWGGAGESKSSVMAFVPYTRDAERFAMVRGGGIMGMRKVAFEGRDSGVIVASTYGAPIAA